MATSYIYNKVSAQSNLGLQHQSVNPDLKYWLLLKVEGGQQLVTFTDLYGYTLAVQGLAAVTLDYGTFENKVSL